MSNSTQPVGVSSLPAFCTELTGITQDMVDDQPTWPETLEMFVSWYNHNDLTPDNSTFVTCGLWDLKTMLPRQSQYSGLPIPDPLNVGSSGEYINLKYSFQQHTGKFAKVNFVCPLPRLLQIFSQGLMDMQKFLGLQFEGRLHSGEDDSDVKTNVFGSRYRRLHQYSQDHGSSCQAGICL